MLNIIGTHPNVDRVLSVPDTHLHLYAKSERPGRKLGHITVRSRTPELLAARLETLAGALAE
jgi:5-(carboxyamino)imidazole ribonucleotide synthase